MIQVLFGYELNVISFEGMYVMMWWWVFVEVYCVIDDFWMVLVLVVVWYQFVD